MAISRFQMNRQLRAYGGLMGDDGRKAYGIGSFFQEKIMDPIKKVVKSDAGKAAAAIGALKPRVWSENPTLVLYLSLISWIMLSPTFSGGQGYNDEHCIIVNLQVFFNKFTAISSSFQLLIPDDKKTGFPIDAIFSKSGKLVISPDGIL